MDRDNENILQKIQEILGRAPTNLSILEEQINIDLQMEYFEQSRNIDKSFDAHEIINRKEDLFATHIPSEDKKLLFIQLATLNNIEAYRTIEKYVQKPEAEMRDWALLALQESRMLLESKLLDENQVFISTGLGGKGSKLRYFIVLIKLDAQPFKGVEQKVIQGEFEFLFRKTGCEMEELHFHSTFATMMVVIPLEITIKDLFDRGIHECNQYGNFLRPHFIVTNVKPLSTQEISDFLESKEAFDNL